MPSGKCWNDDELELISDLVGYYAPIDLFIKYQQKAEEYGLPFRSKNAIKSKIQALNWRTMPRYDNLPSALWEKALGLPRCRIGRMMRRGNIHYTQKGKYKIIHSRSLRDAAEKHPQSFAGAKNEDAMLFYFGESLVAKIRQSSIAGRNSPKPVINTKTGERYPGILSASKQTGEDRKTIRAHCEETVKVPFRWKYA